MIDVYRVFEHIPELLGMDLERNGDRWQGGYYLNGDIHAWRKDKLKITKWGNNIWLHEEGGSSMNIVDWLCSYGGVSSKREAYDMLSGRGLSIVYEHKERVKDVRYIDRGVLDGYSRFPLECCPLYVWMSSLFGSERVREAWGRYHVTTNAIGDVVFWYMDGQGRLLHDKVMRYGMDGHRDKSFGGSRVYRSSDGFIGRCYFGEHLIGKEGDILVTESEKSALLLSLYSGDCVIATGGKNNLRGYNERYVLYPDMDAYDEWLSSGNRCVEWYKDWGIDSIPSNADIGDMIEWRIKNGL